MACMKLGSKSEMFYLYGQSCMFPSSFDKLEILVLVNAEEVSVLSIVTSLASSRLCSTGLPSDIIIEIGDTSFHLHKFPLISRSRELESLMREVPCEPDKSVLELHGLPGGAKAFLHVAKFCYGVKMELTASNVVGLRCAAEYLQMSENYGEGNLIMQTEKFLNHVFGYWTDTLVALKTCEEVLPMAEELHIASRSINSLVLKVADQSLVNLPVSSGPSVAQSPEDAEVWNGISLTPKASGEDWWFDDVSSLSLPLYKRFIRGASARNIKPNRIAGSLVYYAKKHIPLLGSQTSSQSGNSSSLKSSLSTPSEADQRNLIEEIVELLPNEKGIAPTKFLLGCLRTAMALYASSSCCSSLEKRIGSQLDEADLEDLLIPNIGFSMETVHDIDCVQRMLDHFMIVEHDLIDTTSNDIEEERQIVASSQPLSPMAKNSQNLNANLPLIRNDGSIPHNPVVAFDNMKERVAELEKEYLSMKQDMEKMMKSKGGWNVLLRKLGWKLVPKPSNANVSKPCRKSKISPATTAQMEEKAMEVK
ncbi:BTB/POZ domain-containing protein [Vigna angularis]|uniref:BTB/POZ domain-containing protein n=1 Tax=Phaseolus angularis TaxID=3914 RepID=A0A8T0KQR2_PHAAN|nr:BTB/POZ domain-containing protein [Vigna angularis]